MDNNREGGTETTERLPVGRLDGRIVVVTGAASGLGRACAGAVLAAGGSVLAIDRDGPGLTAALEADPERTELWEGDITAEGDVRAAVDRAIERFGRVDGLVASAGIAGEGSAISVTEERWRQVLDVNLTGVWLSIRAVLPHMAERRTGSIVLISSITALVGRPGIAAYAAAKGGVCALARQVAYDAAPENVRVNSICPGTVLTEMALRAYEGRGVIDPGAPDVGIERLGAAYPLRRLGEPADVGDAAVFLLGDGASWITGATLPVDGGLTSLDVPAVDAAIPRRF